MQTEIIKTHMEHAGEVWLGYDRREQLQTILHMYIRSYVFLGQTIKSYYWYNITMYIRDS